MLKSKFIMLFLLPSLITPSCKSMKYGKKTNKTEVLTSKNKITLNDSLPAYKSIAISEYGDSVSYLFNESQDFVVCYIKTEKLVFFIYNITTNEIVFEDSIFDGKIKWIRPNVLQVNVIPENALPTYNIERSGYHYMVKENKLVPIQ